MVDRMMSIIAAQEYLPGIAPQALRLFRRPPKSRNALRQAGCIANGNRMTAVCGVEDRWYLTLDIADIDRRPPSRGNSEKLARNHQPLERGLEGNQMEICNTEALRQPRGRLVRPSDHV